MHNPTILCIIMCNRYSKRKYKNITSQNSSIKINKISILTFINQVLISSIIINSKTNKITHKYISKIIN